MYVQGHKGGLTNKEKQRKKNFVMVRKGKRSVANKIRKSNSDVRYDKMKHVSLTLMARLWSAVHSTEIIAVVIVVVPIIAFILVPVQYN